MFKLKNTKTIILAASVFVVTLLSTSVVQAVPAGCPGGPAGPPTPGTVCPDGTVFPDGTLPIGCPGSSQQGPVANDYTASCPARAGREACTYSRATGQCTTASGQNAVPNSATAPTGTPTTPSASASSRPNQCVGANIAPDDNCLILKYIVDGTNMLSALVGIVVVIMIVVGGLQYSSARDNPQASAAAKEKIRNAILALVVYLFMWGILQYLVPGGVL